ncbi:MAG: hypothetical protein ACTSPB_01495 [Candidatus Thorarchaeota archaeon]
MPTETFTIKGRCGKILHGKIWKQGGTLKCPNHWSFNTYPKPSIEDLRQDMLTCCKDCEELKKEASDA